MGALLAGLTLAYAGINKVINEATDNLIKQNDAQSRLSESLAENAANSFKEATQAYIDINDIAQRYLSTTRQLASAEEAVKVATEKLTVAIQNYGVGSQQALDAQAELSEQEARLKSLQVERGIELDKLREKTLLMTESTGALKNVTTRS